MKIIKNSALYGITDELGLKWTDIDFKNQTLTVTEAKDNEFRRIELHPEGARILKSLPRTDDAVFPGMDLNARRRIAKDIKKDSGLTNIKRFWYATRHTFATEYYKQTDDLEGLQKILGHSKIEMTMVYVTPQQQHRREQIRKLKYSFA